MTPAEHLYQLQQIPSFAKRVRYANEHFTNIAKGSARAVYDMGNDKVVKLAINGKGLAQNEIEGQGYMSSMYNILSPAIEAGDDGIYVVSKKFEKVKGIRQVCDMIGVDKQTLEKFVNQMHRNILYRNEDKHRVDHVENNFILEMQQICVDCDMLPGDWSRPSSYGIDPDNNALILIDWGLNRDTYIEHYMRRDNHSGYGY